MTERAQRQEPLFDRWRKEPSQEATASFRPAVRVNTWVGPSCLRMLPLGVDRVRRRYRARITINKVQQYFGLYTTPEEAAAAVRRARPGGRAK